MNFQKNSVRHQFTTRPSSTRLHKELAGVREQRAASLSAPAQPEGQGEGGIQRPGREGLRLSFRKIAALGAIGLFGIFGAPKVAEVIAPTPTGHTYTQDELARMPQKPYTFQPNQGIDDAIVKVNGESGVFSDGPDLTAVREYITDQAEGTPDPNETVPVPVLPEADK